MASAATGTRLAPPAAPPGARAASRWVWGLAGTTVLLSVIAAALALWLLYEHQRQHLRAMATNSSQLAAEQAQAIFNAARFRVQAVERELKLRTPNDPHYWLRNPDELRELLIEIAQVNPERGLFALGAIDPAGRVLAVSVSPEARGADVSDRPYFRALLDGASRAIGEPTISRAVGVRVIPYAEWLEDGAGEPVLVLTASIDTAFLERLYRGVMGNDLVVSALFREDGAFMAGVWPSGPPPPLEDEPGWILARTLVLGWPLIGVAGVPAPAVWQGILLPSAMIVGVVLLLSAGIVVVTQVWQQRQRAFAELLRVEHQQDVLLRELNHRAKNIVAVIQAMALQTLRHSSDWAEFKPAFMGRLDALARTLALPRVQSWEAAELRELARTALAPHRGGGNIRISGPEVTLPPEAALTLSLALHELATNAAKYGALSVPQGRVEVAWRVDAAVPSEGERRLVLDWTELDGPKVPGAPERRGFGSALIERSIAYELDGATRLEFPPEGVRCRIELPLTRTDPAIRHPGADPSRGTPSPSAGGR